MKAISSEKICYLIVKSREFDVKEGVTIPDSGSNPTDDGDHQILADQPDDPVYEELLSFLEALSEDELIEILALVLLGRGDYDMSEWSGAISAASDDYDENLPHRLLQIPLISDHLGEGMDQFGMSCG